MPPYELTLIMKACERNELSTNLKRALRMLIEEGAVIRNVENLGHRRSPHILYKFQVKHFDGHYFMVQFDSPDRLIQVMRERFTPDRSVLRASVCVRDTPDSYNLQPGALERIVREHQLRARALLEAPPHIGTGAHPLDTSPTSPDAALETNAAWVWRRPCAQPGAVECPFGEITNPMFEKHVGLRKFFRAY